MKAFEKFGINAHFDEDTSEEEFLEKIAAWHKTNHKKEIAEEMVSLCKEDTERFFDVLQKSIGRTIEQIVIIPLHGKEALIGTLSDALDFLKHYDENQFPGPLMKYEISVRYNTGESVTGIYNQKVDAIRFLEIFTISNNS